MKLRRMGFVLALAVAGVGCSTDPDVVKKKNLESGNKYFERGKYKEAIIMYKRALTKDKRYGEAYYRLALTELKLNDAGAAIRDFYRAAELQPENTDATTKLIDLFLAAYTLSPSEGRQIRTELEGIQKKLLASNPNSYDGLRVKGYLALMNNDLAAAEENFQKARTLQPDRPEVTVLLVRVLGALNRGPEAERVGREFLAKHKDSVAVYDALYTEYLRHNDLANAESVLKEKLANNPKPAVHYAQLADFYYRAQRQPEMQATLQRMAAQPNDALTYPPDEPTRYLMLGRFYEVHGNVAEALAQYQRGLSEDAKNKTTYQIRTAQVQIAQKKYDEARKLVDDILRDEPNSIEALTMRAALALETKKPEHIKQAIADMQKVVNLKPDIAVHRMNLGRALYLDDSLEEALVNFQQAVKLNPGPATLQARYAIADIYQKGVDQGTAGKTDRTKRRPDFAKAVSATTEILALDPKSLPALLMRANAEFNLGQMKNCRDDLQAVLKLQPNSADGIFQLARLDLAEANTLLAQRQQILAANANAAEAAEKVRLAQERYRTAEAGFRHLQENKDPRGFMGLVESTIGQGKAPAAVGMLKDALAKDPSRVENHLALANIYAATQNLDGALEEYGKVLEKVPNSVDVIGRMGTVYRAKGDVPRAMEYFERAQKLAPTDIRPTLEIANLYEIQGQHLKARPLYERILQLQGDNAVALNNLAYILADEAKDLDTALAYAQRARQKAPDSAEISDTLGLIYVKKNLPDTAMPYLLEVVRKNPNRAAYRLHMAEAYAQKQDKQQARRELEAASRSNPTKEEQEKIKQLAARVG